MLTMITKLSVNVSVVKKTTNQLIEKIIYRLMDSKNNR